MKLLIVALTITVTVGKKKIPDEDQIGEAWDAIEGLIEDNERLAAKFLRLAFHDCVSPRCDGCININLEDNGGLEIPIEALESVYRPNGKASDHSRAMSRADFWTLAGIIGVQWAIETSNNDYSAEIDAAPLTFKPGRRDCPSSPYTTEVHSFPNPNGGSAETFEYFKTTFGLSKYETVALMGGHTIGKATKANVGFQGQWTGPDPRAKFQFDGTYHHIMLVHDYGWTLQNLGSEDKPKYQWECTDLAKPEDEDRNCGFMLNTDLSMLINLTVDSKGEPTCDFFTPFDDNECGIDEDNYEQMYTYDSSFTDPPESENNFVNDFSAAFTKVINRI